MLLSKQIEYRVTWEMSVIGIMEEIGQMTTSDAQGQIMIREDLLNELFSKDATPTEAAKIILNLCIVKPSQKLTAAAEYIFNNGIIANFGTGALSKSTDVCNRQKKLIEEKFNLTTGEFSIAFQMAELLQQKEHQAEVAFFKNHPELNP